MAKTSKKKLETAPDPTTMPPETENIAAVEESEQQTMFEPPPDPEMEDEQPAEPPQATAPAEEPAPTRKKMGRPKRGEEREDNVLDRIAAMESFEGTDVYVYRIEPYSNRLIGANTKVHVIKYQRKIDGQDLLEDCGSGKYQIQVVREDPKTGQRTRIDKAYITIMNPNYPPKIPKGEWVNDPRNKEWMWAKEYIDRADAATVARQTVQDSSNALLSPVIDMFKEQNRMNSEELRSLRAAMLAQQQKKPDDGTVHPLVQMLAPVMPALLTRLLEPPKPDPTQALFMQFLMKQLEVKQQTSEPVSPEAALEKNLTIMQKMEEYFGGRNNGGSARSRMSGTQELIAEAMKAFGPSIGPIMQMLMMSQQRPPQAAPSAASSQQTYTPPPAAQPSPMPQQQPPQQPGGPQLVKTPPTVSAFAGSVKHHLEQNWGGLDLGDWYLKTFGEDEFREIRVQGKAEVMRLLQSDTAAWQALEPFAKDGRLDKMITEFLTWTPNEEEEDEEEEGPPPATATASTMPAAANGWSNPAPMGVNMQGQQEVRS